MLNAVIDTNVFIRGLLGSVLNRADVVVTHDPDLLCLHPFHNVSIISPKEFMLKIKS